MNAEITTGPTITTMSLDEATVIRASGHQVSTILKPCTRKAMFEFADTTAIRALLDRYSKREILPISARLLLTTRADLYREARAARGGL